MAKQEERRRFLKQGALALGGLAISGTYFSSCSMPEQKKVAGRLLGPNFTSGHLLRQGIKVEPQEQEEVDVVIVGGGVAGLSAARWLKKHSSLSVCLLELEEKTGGNSMSGQNQYAAYPWGAHYLPLPNLSNTELLDFLHEEEVITGYDAKGLPLYNEYYLCFDPEERLFINGYWQQGLVPTWSVPKPDQKQIEQFLAKMEQLKQAKGQDGKFAFDIPLANSSADQTYRQLDTLTMEEWLKQEGFNSSYLSWYVDYCCLDDFGAPATQVSAWAGIHYFASRKAQAGNSDAHRVLTWPQGNHWLAERLRAKAGTGIRTGALAYQVQKRGELVLVDYLLPQTKKYKRLVAKHCIMATPQFVGNRLLGQLAHNRKVQSFSYAPWLVANLIVKQVPFGKGTALSWDNVIYGSKSLGYVYASQQNVELYPDKQVITFYHPLAGESLSQARQMAYQNKYEDWSELVLKELEKAHPSIREEVEQLDVWVWGHGMIRPAPGFIWGNEREQASEPLQKYIHFAHSDLSGISIFEEAFYQGIKAANQILHA